MIISQSSSPTAAFVTSVWRYPVKSMLGEELTITNIGEQGVLGDRAYALVDRETGKVASAKNPRKWAKLFACAATYDQPPEHPQTPSPVSIRLPDGTLVSSRQSNIDEMLSKIFGRELTMETTAPQDPSLEEYWPDIDGLAHREVVTDESIGMAAPAGTFFDYAPIHLITTATLRQLAALYPRGRFAVERFRPNLVVESQTSETGFLENAWVGRIVRIGSEVQLRVSDPCARCVMTTLAQQDLEHDPGILRAAAQYNKVVVPAFGQALPSVGVYATVLRGGVVRTGDAVYVD
ncbi:MAG: MOSC domain-containing protein [Bryobacteraceae bacterium]